MTRSNNNAVEKLERQFVENKGKETSETEFLTGEVDKLYSTGNPEEFKRGGRVECGPKVKASRPNANLWVAKELWRGVVVYKGERRRERHHNRGPRKPNVNFSHFDGGNPHEWLDKVKHYFQVYEVVMAYQKGKGDIDDSSKKESKDVKTVTKEEVQERIKKGMCFKCKEKWNKDHQCRTGKIFMIIDSSESNDDVVSDEEATSDDGELK
ncbi:hypothetical protein Ddye_021364, partial [Dipteronia dyeriana]